MTAIDHDWMRTRLGWPLTGEEEIRVQPISVSGGLMGNVHQVGCGGRSFVFKSAPNEGTTWASFVIDAGLVRREVECYRLLQREHVDVAPACHWSELAPDGRGALVLEDFGSSAGLMAPGLSRTQALATMRCLAVLHASTARAGADPLRPPCDWMLSAGSADLVEAVRLGLTDLPRFTDVPVSRAVGQADVAAELMRAHVGAKLVSLCHGDPWASNILFTGGTARLIDWQFAMWGNPLSDVALLLVSSLTPRSRQLWEEELLHSYHATLTSRLPLPYPIDDCRADLERAEPFAALVALATLEAYTCGMDTEASVGFASRVRAAMSRFLLGADDDVRL